MVSLALSLYGCNVYVYPRSAAGRRAALNRDGPSARGAAGPGLNRSEQKELHNGT